MVEGHRAKRRRAHSNTTGAWSCIIGSSLGAFAVFRRFYRSYSTHEAQVDGRHRGIMFRRILLSALLSIVAANWGFAQVTVKVGVLNDQSGVYADVGGKGSVVAAQLAVEDFKAAGSGLQ